ncbi:MAG: winged helix-turn-helix domain-containing protein [Polyangiaceae bacterium]
MSDLGWREAVVAVLTGNQGPMHYVDIADAIVDKKLRDDFGATPAISVNVAITQSLKNDSKSPFIRVGPGIYALRPVAADEQSATQTAPPTDDEPDETGLINALGMYWSRAFVLWSPVAPKLLGQQQSESTPVDFCQQRGVYLLHDGRSVVYVGRTTEQPLGVRLRQHIADRLNGRWDRFSWFGTSSVDESGALVAPTVSTYSLELLIVTMEALLIEGLEPPQNRKRGDDFRAIEFLQLEDPEIRKKNIIMLMDELKAKL